MIPTLLLIAVAAQQPPAGRPVPQRQTIVRDSLPGDTVRRNVPRRAAVTPELAASAFKDAATKALFEKARRTRTSQDSTLRNYDAITRQRMSVDLGIGKVGREHLFWRQESAARVQWQHDVGAWVDVTGARVGIPMAPKQVEVDNLVSDISRMSPIPYYPGYESLWVGGNSAARTEADEREIVNPLAVGSEAYYTFALTDSLKFRLQDGTLITLREIEMRPRVVHWNLAVGSLWFDDNGQLVKAVYRLSTPIDFWTTVNENEAKDGGYHVPAAVSGFLSPMRAQITGVAIEYSLHGTHWLPRLRSMQGSAQALFARIPMTIDQRFEYRSVNGPDTLTKIDTTKLPAYIPPLRRDSLRRGDSLRRAERGDSIRRTTVGPVTVGVRVARDSADRRRIDSIRAATRTRSEDRDKRMAAVADSLERGLPATGLVPGSPGAIECTKDSVRTVYLRRFATGMPVAARIPCNLQKLIHSPDLPPSIYDPGEELFDTKDRDEMMKQALDMAAQAPISFGALPPASWVLGFPMTRYNRVEGLSTGVAVDQQLGGGYDVGALARFGFADHDPGVELTAARSNLSKTIRLTAYHHLVSASDWGNPLSFGSSFSALFFGKDEGFYYRTTGGELTWTRGEMSKFEWRIFADQQKTAAVETDFAVFGHLAADRLPNITALEGTFYGRSAD